MLVVACTAQLLPFQRSARVRVVKELSVDHPTAVQAPLVEQATAASELDVAPLGLGVLCIAQLAPFHRSANVSAPELVSSSPTAVQAVVEAHVMPFK